MWHKCNEVCGRIGQFATVISELRFLNKFSLVFAYSRKWNGYQYTYILHGKQVDFFNFLQQQKKFEDRNISIAFPWIYNLGRCQQLNHFYADIFSAPDTTEGIFLVNFHNLSKVLEELNFPLKLILKINSKKNKTEA